MTENMLLLAPEIYLALAAMALLLFGAFRGDRATGVVFYLADFALLVAGVGIFLVPESGTAFGDRLIFDSYGRFAKLFVIGASLLTLIMAPHYMERIRQLRPEGAVLVLFATLGAMLMISAHDFLAFYVGLELQSLSLYVLAGFRRDQPSSSEAGLKYFVLGALASSLLLYGISLFYGYTGTTQFSALAQVIGKETVPVGLSIGLVFILAAFSFKISAVPFHMWTPDVFEGAPTPFTAFFATVPKIAGLAVLGRVLMGPMNALGNSAQEIVICLSVATMAVGAFTGIVQPNIKRLMAYSSIVNVGFMLIGFVCGDEQGIQAMLVYLGLYVLATLGAFAVILCLRRKGRAALRISDMAGLGKTHPWIAVAMTIFMFSLAGVPPLAGFFGKYFVLLAAVHRGFTLLAVFGVLMSVVAAFYYLRIVKIMYFDSAAAVPLDPVPEQTLRFVMSLSALLIALFVLNPEPLIAGALQAAQSLFL